MIVVVSHADVIKLMLAQYMGIHIDLFQRIAVSPISVSALALEKDGRVYVVRVNDHGPLQAPPKSDEDKESEGVHSSNSSQKKMVVKETAKLIPTKAGNEKD
jgi:probable phosphoglycerate mutase